MIEAIGFLAGLCFAVSAIPLAASAVRSRQTDVPWSTAGLVTVGALLMLIYALGIGAVPLVCDMVVTGVCWVTISAVKYRQRASTVSK